MKNCVVKKQESYEVVRTSQPHTPGCIAHLPTNTPYIDFKFITKLPDGTISVDKKLKSEWMKEQIKNANV